MPAHFDGQRICLDEPFDLQPKTKLIVTIIPEQESDKEHESWLNLSRLWMKNQREQGGR
jgi:hypothetical protein